MDKANLPKANLGLSHFELYVRDSASMEKFYTQCLGFVVTDRGEGVDGMVFLTRNPAEHHQLVFNPHTQVIKESPLDHIAFRVDSLAELRLFHHSLQAGEISMQTVSHGNTWSLYFRDPENNRLEIFTDTPWFVSQPCKFEVDFDLSDSDLAEFTKKRIEGMPGFKDLSQWKGQFVSTIEESNT